MKDPYELIICKSSRNCISESNWSCACAVIQIHAFQISNPLISTCIPGWTVLIQAASEGKLDFVKWLIESGAKVNMTMGSGWTALHAASKNGHVKVGGCECRTYMQVKYVG